MSIILTIISTEYVACAMFTGKYWNILLAQSAHRSTQQVINLVTTIETRDIWSQKSLSKKQCYQYRDAIYIFTVQFHPFLLQQYWITRKQNKQTKQTNKQTNKIKTTKEKEKSASNALYMLFDLMEIFSCVLKCVIEVCWRYLLHTLTFRSIIKIKYAVSTRVNVFIALITFLWWKRVEEKKIRKWNNIMFNALFQIVNFSMVCW